MKTKYLFIIIATFIASLNILSNNKVTELFYFKKSSSKFCQRFGNEDGVISKGTSIFPPPGHPDFQDTNSVPSQYMKDCTLIKQISIKNIITEIEDEAFMNCNNLKFVMLGNASCLKRLGNRAFKNCKKLKNLSIINSTVAKNKYDSYKDMSLSGVEDEAMAMYNEYADMINDPHAAGNMLKDMAVDYLEDSTGIPARELYNNFASGNTRGIFKNLCEMVVNQGDRFRPDKYYEKVPDPADYQSPSYNPYKDRRRKGNKGGRRGREEYITQLSIDEIKNELKNNMGFTDDHLDKSTDGQIINLYNYLQNKDSTRIKEIVNETINYGKNDFIKKIGLNENEDIESLTDEKLTEIFNKKGLDSYKKQLGFNDDEEINYDPEILKEKGNKLIEKEIKDKLGLLTIDQNNLENKLKDYSNEYLNEKLDMISFNKQEINNKIRKEGRKNIKNILNISDNEDITIEKIEKTLIDKTKMTQLGLKKNQELNSENIIKIIRKKGNNEIKKNIGLGPDEELTLTNIKKKLIKNGKKIIGFKENEEITLDNLENKIKLKGEEIIREKLNLDENEEINFKNIKKNIKKEGVKKLYNELNINLISEDDIDDDDDEFSFNFNISFSDIKDQIKAKKDDFLRNELGIPVGEKLTATNMRKQILSNIKEKGKNDFKNAIGLSEDDDLTLGNVKEQIKQNMKNSADSKVKQMFNINEPDPDEGCSKTVNSDLLGLDIPELPVPKLEIPYSLPSKPDIFKDVPSNSEMCDMAISALEEIGLECYYGCEMIATVYIGPNVKMAGERAFAHCKNLVTAEFGVLTNGSDSDKARHYSKQMCRMNTFGLSDVVKYSTGFDPCDNLVSKIEEIAVGLFEDCDKLVNVNIVPSILKIGDNAFEGCEKLENLVYEGVPHVEKIGNSAFKNCKSLVTVGLPDTVNEIGDNVYESCDKIDKVLFSDNSELVKIGNKAFINCKNLVECQLGPEIESFGESCFENCENISNIAIANAQVFGNDVINKIETQLVSNLNFITQIDLVNTKLKSISENCFKNCSSIVTVNVVNSITKIENGAFNGCSSLKNVIFESAKKLENIGNEAFKNCINLDKIILPDKINFIGESAFEECRSLVHFSCHSKELKKISENCFKNCVGLSNVVVENIESIGNNAFNKCENLSNIVVYNLKDIGESAFEGCTNLQQDILKNSESMLNIGKGAFKNCVNLVTVTIPNSITKIEDEVFKNCNNLEKLIINPLESELVDIGNEACKNCKKLEQISLKYINKIGDEAFKGAENLEIFIDDIDNIGSDAVLGVKNMLNNSINFAEEIGSKIQDNLDGVGNKIDKVLTEDVTKIINEDIDKVLSNIESEISQSVNNTINELENTIKLSKEIQNLGSKAEDTKVFFQKGGDSIKNTANDAFGALKNIGSGGGGGGGCIGSNTILETDKGKIKLKELKEGDKILSYDKETNKILYSTIYYIRNHGNKKILHYKIKFSNNDIVILSKEHLLILENDTYIQAQKIKVGDKIKNVYNKNVSVKEIEKIYDIPLTPIVICGNIILPNKTIISCWSQDINNVNKMNKLCKELSKYVEYYSISEIKEISHNFYEMFKMNNKNMSKIDNIIKTFKLEKKIKI